MKRGWAFLIWLYLFIISIELIKKTSLMLSEPIHLFINSSLTPIKALSIGWVSASILQSGGAVGGIVIPFVANNLLTIVTAIFIMMGARIGGTITALFVSIILGVKKKRRDFRHGFEIALAHVLLISFTIIIAFFLECFFHLFSKLGITIANLIEINILIYTIPTFLKLITKPIIDVLCLIPSKFFLLALALIILILALRFFTKSIILFLGGEEKARKFINKNFKSKYKTFFIGLLFTLLVFSTAISITLLVPLAVSRLINLKKAIPFIIGATIGTSIDVVLAALITGNISAYAVAISYILFSLIGVILFLPNTNLLFNLTKFISKRIIHISERKALIFLIIFILIPLLIFLL